MAQRRADVPVLLMTGYAERLQQAVAQRVEVLPKPLAPSVLAAALKRAMGARTAIRT